MKTLKEIVKRKGRYFQYYKENGDICYTKRQTEKMLFESEVIETVQELLKDHIQESPCKKCLSNDVCQRPQENALEVGFYGCLSTDAVKKHNQVIDELLTSLCVDSTKKEKE